MFKNYLKIAVRNLIRFKGYSFINIVGLAIGVACTLLIVLWVQDELNFDRHHENASRIYRVVIELDMEGGSSAYTPPPLAAALKNDFPEIQQVTRLGPWVFNRLVSYQDKSFLEKNIKGADGAIFDVFTIPFVQGNPRTALSKPNSIVITESMARKYFGSQDPMGKTISINGPKNMYEVTGVVKDCPENTHFYFDFIRYRDWNTLSWGNHCLFTYILLPENYNPEMLEAKLPDFLIRNMGGYIQKEYGVSITQYYDNKNRVYDLKLQPLSDIHLNAAVIDNTPNRGSYSTITIFSIIAMFILIIACVNFINLATARSSTRTKEVGLRKAMGSNRSMLIRQFLSEAILLIFISTLLALLIAELMLPFYNQLVGKNLSIHLLSQPGLILILLSAVFLIGFLTGFYPAFTLSSFQPLAVLKSHLGTGVKRSGLKTALVVFQFAITIVMFISMFVVFRQSIYVRNARLGFNQNQVLVIDRAYALGDQAEVFKKELSFYPDVLCVSETDSLPGRHFEPNGHRMEGRSMSEEYTLHTMYSDHNYINLLDLKVVQGRFFSEDIASDVNSVVINEAAVKKLRLENPIGKRFIKDFGDAKEGEFVTIIGILKDFHFMSMHHQIEPMLIRNLGGDRGYYISVKLSTGHLNQTIKKIEKNWKQFSGNQPFVYSFLDEDFNALYQAEIKTGQILAVFFVLSIFISCLGLFGLSAFMAEQRTKEIGIRKVLGASISRVVFLLTRETGKWVLMGSLIAWPIAWFAMHRWLQNFAYRITIQWWFFILAGMLGLVIALLTVSYQAVRAARANPVDSLRYE